jgi:hypothetical protein
MEAQFKSGARPPAWRRKGIEARLRRQEILERTDGTAPRLSVVITEASLRYRWGIHGDRREQIEHLAEMSKRRNVEMRIQRFDDGPPTGIYSMTNIHGVPRNTRQENGVISSD